MALGAAMDGRPGTFGAVSCCADKKVLKNRWKQCCCILTTIALRPGHESSQESSARTAG